MGEKAMASSPLTWRVGSLALAVVLLFSSPAAEVLAAEATVRADSPQRYTVVEGDTLWDVAGRFLEQPWLWPQVWQINPQIDNPDLIFPGDVIELAYEDGQPVLRLSRDLDSGPGPQLDSGPGPQLRTVRLSPQVRREALGSAIPAIAPDLINSLLNANVVLSARELDASAYMLGEQDGRAVASAGDEVLARGAWTPGVQSYDIVRPGRVLLDPDTGELLGTEALHVGTASISRSRGDQAVLRIDSSVLEARRGDRFVPHQALELTTTLMPTPPAFAVDAAIVGIGTGKLIGGRYDTVVLNVGRRDGINVGHLLSTRKPDVAVNDDIGKTGSLRRVGQVFGVDDSNVAVFPGRVTGSVLVYRVFDDASMGIVLTSIEALRIEDRVVTP